MRPKSKRVSLSQKYRIAKKVKEHNRKAKRDAKKNPTKKGSSSSSMKKDPGVPNLWPFKEQLLRQMEEKKERAEQMKEKQKSQREKLLQKRRSLTDLQKSAAKKQAEFNKKNKGEMDVDSLEEHNAGRGKENSRRAFYKEFKKVATAADVILEVLDARDPLGCRCPQIEKRILALSPNKKIVLILNKIDLVPREVVEKWLKYLRADYPTIAFKASTQSQRTHLGQSSVDTATASSDLLASSECLGADTLIKLLKNYARNKDIKTTVTVGIIGQPNVGKSSIINSLKRSKACQVGPTPGVTRTAQQIHLDKNIRLLDCPGIVFPAESESATDGFDSVLRGSVKIEQVEDPASHVEIILSRCEKSKIMEIYNVPWFDTVAEFLVMLAQKRGKLRKGGVADVDVVSRSILQDWNVGKIPFYTLPPADKPSSHLESQIVSSWGQQFDLNSLMEQENASVLASLKSEKEQGPFMTFTASAANNVDMALDEDDDDEEDEEDDDAEDDDAEDDDEEDEEDEDDDDDDGTNGMDVDDDDDVSSLAKGTGMRNVAQVALLKGKQKQAFLEYQQQTDPAGASASAATLLGSRKQRQQQQQMQQAKLSLLAAEDDLNPQFGKDLRKQQKSAKKLRKKQGRSSGDSMEDGGDDDDDDDDDEEERAGNGSYGGAMQDDHIQSMVNEDIASRAAQGTKGGKGGKKAGSKGKGQVSASNRFVVQSDEPYDFHTDFGSSSMSID